MSLPWESSTICGIPGIHNRKDEDIGRKAPRWLHISGDIQRFNKELIPMNLFMFRKVMLGAPAEPGAAAGGFLLDVSHVSYLGPEGFLPGLSLPPEKIYTENKRHGHMQETDMVLDYVDAIEAGSSRKAT